MLGLSAIRYDCRSDIVEIVRNEGSSSLYRVIHPVFESKASRTRDLPAATPDQINMKMVYDSVCKWARLLTVLT